MDIYKLRTRTEIPKYTKELKDLKISKKKENAEREAEMEVKQ